MERKKGRKKATESWAKPHEDEWEREKESEPGGLEQGADEI